jgi:hypothetical protein
LQIGGVKFSVDGFDEFLVDVGSLSMAVTVGSRRRAWCATTCDWEPCSVPNAKPYPPTTSAMAPAPLSKNDKARRVMALSGGAAPVRVMQFVI